MKRSQSISADAAELRQRAEERLKKKSTETDLLRKEADQRLLLQELQVHQIELELQNEDLRQAKEEIQTGLEKYTDLYDFAPMGYFTLGRNGAIRAANLTGAGLLGIERARLIGKPFWSFIEPESRPALKSCLEKVFERKAKETCEVALLKKDKHPLFVRIEATLSEDGQECRAVLMDITERQQAQAREQLVTQVLDLLNRAAQKREMIRDLLLLVKDYTGFEAVGLRVREGEDFPYCTVIGLAAEFVETDKYLFARDKAGELVRDSAGLPVPECMCGDVLCGRINPHRPFFTPGGSFWTNSTSDLLTSTGEADHLARMRRGCLGHGYELVALIPLRSGGKVMGLLQLNDRRKGQLTPEMVAFFEGIGASIGIAMAHQQAEAERERLIGELQETLAHVKTLRGLLPICASCKKIRDDQGYWNQIEAYVENHTDALFSHGICPDCAKKLYPK